MPLQPVQQACVPRKDVRSGSISAVDFAARLEQVVSDPDAYPDYGDPDRFFSLTYPTNGMKRLLTGVFGRLSDQDLPGTENPVLRFQTSFGGGKTHGLIAAYHVARGHRPGLEFFDPGFDESTIPTNTQVAAVVGEQLDPVNGTELSGYSAYTLWGAIGAQLGPRAWEVVRDSDATRTAPGTQTIKRMLDGKPTLVIVDEVAQYLRTVSSSASEQVRDLAKSLPAFFKSLFEVAAERGSRLVVVITLASERDAYNTETTELSDLLDTAMGEASSILARQEAVLVPATDDEIAAILRRRLFESIDRSAAEAAAEAHRELYEHLITTGEPLPSGAAQPASYADRIAASYPFHPELVRVLDSRIATIPTFQRARGALRLLAASIQAVWDDKLDRVMLNVADVPLGSNDVLYELTERLGKSRLRQPAEVDIAGPTAHAAEVDAARFAGKPFATRAATCVFLHSLEQVSSVGAGRGDYLLGSLRPGDTAEVYEEALAALWAVAWHLSYDNVRWRFQIEANARAVIEEEATNIPRSLVTEEMERKVAQAFSGVGAVKVVHEPAGPGDVPDEARLQLVVMHAEDSSASVTNPAIPLPAPRKIRELARSAGVSGNHRRHRNGLVFLCPDPSQVEPLKTALRRQMGAARILGSDERREALGAEVVTQVQAIKDTSDVEVLIAVGRCYANLYYPARDQANDDLHHHELPAKTKGEVQGRGISQTQSILDSLRSLGKIKPAEPALAPSYLREKTWKNQDEISLDKVLDWFWCDPSMEMPVDSTRVVECVRAGVRNGDWVYYEADTEKAWTDRDPPPPVRISENSFLMTPERADTAGVVATQLTAALLESTLTAAAGSLSGSELYDRLADQIGRRPTKKDLVAILQRVAIGPTSRLAVIEGELVLGTPQLGPTQLERLPHERLTFLTRAVANRGGVAANTTRAGPATVNENGAAAVAFAKVAEKAAEVTGAQGARSVRIEARANPGDGIGALRALAMVIGMTPQLEFRAELELDLGLAHGDASVHFDGPGGDYQKLEADLMRFAAHADQAQGSLTLEATPRGEALLSPGTADWRTLATNVETASPGHVTIEVALATEGSA